MPVSNRTRRAAAALVWLAAAPAVVAGCTLPSQNKSEPLPAPPDLNRPPPAVATQGGPYDAGPVPPPAEGALFGAWIKPEQLTQPGRVEAVGVLERTLGRRLDILNTYRRFEQPVGTESDRVFIDRGQILMVSWASGDTRSISAGRHDALIRAQARRFRAAKVPMLLRFRWEMDRPNLRATMWSGADFVAAWKHVRRIFAAERVRNVSWVWCPTAEGFMRGDAPAFYPGDDVVDWTCVDVYAGRDYRPIGELMGPFLAWAAHRPKPIIVGEFGVARAWGSQRRAGWLRDAMRTFKANPQIKAVVYFESDPDGNGPKQQFRLLDDPPALQAFTKLTADPYFRR
jgi:Glycosyl hydrolase family 26